MMHLKIREIYALSEKRNSGECRLFWILVHLGPRRCVGPREIRLAPHLRGGEHKKRQSGERIVLALDVQVCDQDEPADDGLVPDAGFARTRAANPNEWVTDITESGIPAGKEYLPPVIDRYDGMPVAWTCVLSLRTTIQTTKSNKTSPPLAIRDTPSYRKCREGSESGPSRHFSI